MTGLKRKICDSTPCRDSPFFRPAIRRDAADAFFFQEALLQRQEKEEEQKDPLIEGAKTTADKLSEHKPFKDWYEPKLEQLKFQLWDNTRVQDKAALLTFLGLNLGTAATAFALNPRLRGALSDVNIGKPLGLIPYSPLSGFKYKLPDPGKSTYSADFTLHPYLEALHKHHPGSPLTGATFGLDAAYDSAGKGLSLTGGRFGLDFFGGALKAQGNTFKQLSPYPLWLPGTGPGAPGSWLMQEVPGLPPLNKSGFQFMLNADLLKLFPGLRRNF